MGSVSGYLFVVLDCGTGLEEVGAGAVHTGFWFFVSRRQKGFRVALVSSQYCTRPREAHKMA